MQLQKYGNFPDRKYPFHRKVSEPFRSKDLRFWKKFKILKAKWALGCRKVDRHRAGGCARADRATID